ncbi:GNAT family N-acetyltransferase [Gryllotalpicola protaetiae]|uniref:GNAT family N-acetyltransferase n=1 Tax=Gryllotalpicola protaetiae TaxID=2419771 RepID=A0A387BUF3_9MICO|nr:GNAT family N-acetyltransferase [Gryllotalpicola protaetiae]AYG04720.1 GNAT family N-acetyltransferase [Gryllotalpicola protaetiae]
MPENPADHPQLDNPAWYSLTGAHAGYARGAGRALRYDPEVSVWGATPDDASAADWAALGALLAPGEHISLPGRELPDGWEGDGGTGLQMLDTGFEPRDDDGAGLVTLTAADVPEMVDLVERTQPGPFAPRTIELGGYLGVRVDGKLVAMAGRRMHPAGWVEISAVCTDEDYRGRGYAARLVRAVASGIRADGERAFLHVRWDNYDAKRVYERLGFVVRREFPFSFGQPVGADERNALTEHDTAA